MMSKDMWALLALVLTLVFIGACFLAVVLTPNIEMSGMVTDMWVEADGDHVLEIDNSFTMEVDCFEYHNAAVGWAYHWTERSDMVDMAALSMIPAVVLSWALIAIMIGDD